MYGATLIARASCIFSAAVHLMLRRYCARSFPTYRGAVIRVQWGCLSARRMLAHMLSIVLCTVLRALDAAPGLWLSACKTEILVFSSNTLRLYDPRRASARRPPGHVANTRRAPRAHLAARTHARSGYCPCSDRRRRNPRLRGIHAQGQLCTGGRLLMRHTT